MGNGDTGLQPAYVGITIGMPSLALVFVALRLYSRRFLTNTFGWDETLIVVPMALSIAMAVAAVRATYLGYSGYHYADIPWATYNSVDLAKWQYAMQLLYNPILALVKNGVLLLLLRLTGTKKGLRRFIIAIMVFNTLLMVAIFFADVFQCTPVKKIFFSKMPGSCIDTGDMYIATAGLTILTDLLVVMVPSWITAGLQMRLRKKIGVVAVLSLGFCVTGVSVYRLWYLVNAYYGPVNSDPLYSLAGTAVSFEVNLAIIAACGPALRPLIKAWLPSIFGSSGKPSAYHGGGGGAPTNTRAARYGGGTGTGAGAFHGGGGTMRSVIRAGESNDDAFEMATKKPRPVVVAMSKIDQDDGYCDDDESLDECRKVEGDREMLAASPVHLGTGGAAGGAVGIQCQTDINVTYSSHDSYASFV